MATGPLHSISPSMWRDSCLEDFQVALCPLCESYLNVPWYSRAFGSSLPGDLGLMRPVEFSLLWEICLWNKMSMQAIQVLRGANISYGNRRFELLLFDVDMKVSLFSKNGAKSIQIQICWLGPEKKAPREEGRYQQGPGLLDGWDHTLILWMLVISCHFFTV